MRLPPFPAVSAGLLAAFVGFTSSFSVVLQGLTAVGATQSQAASGLMAMSIAMGLGGILISVWTKMPISVAWSTPGAALLVSSGMPHGGFASVVGAFLFAALLVVAAGALRPLGRLIALIPASLANAMLGGVLFALCLAPIRAIAEHPAAGIAIAGVWLLVGRVNRLLAVPASAFTAFALIAGMGGGWPTGGLHPDLEFVQPAFDLQATIGIGLPLFLVVMASQNIPGLAILRVHGYTPAAGPLFTTTGLFSLFTAPLGGLGVNLAAITAAICAGEDAGPDRSQRWWAGLVCGVAYIAFGLLAGIVTALATVSPILIQAVAGLALIGAFTASVSAALADPHDREAATVTFLVAASGTVFLGISAPFWGLLAGGGILILTRWQQGRQKAATAAAE